MWQIIIPIHQPKQVSTRASSIESNNRGQLRKPPVNLRRPRMPLSLYINVGQVTYQGWRPEQGQHHNRALRNPWGAPSTWLALRLAGWSVLAPALDTSGEMRSHPVGWPLPEGKNVIVHN